MRKLIVVFVILIPSVVFAGGGTPWIDYSNRSQMQELIMYYNQARSKISEYESRMKYQEERIKELQAENLQLKKQLSFAHSQQPKEKAEKAQNK